MTKINIKWEVSPAPTGPYRSFHRRSWPLGIVNGKNRVIFLCEDDYVPASVKAGNHSPITIKVDVFKDDEMKLVRMVQTSPTLADAKARAKKFFVTNPHYVKP